MEGEISALRETLQQFVSEGGDLGEGSVAGEYKIHTNSQLI